MPLPDFLILGAQKAGTTWLRAMLRQHPRVFLPGRELHFFNKKDRYRRGLDWYARQFTGASDGQLIGEKTPNYLWTNAAEGGSDLADPHRRIAQDLPDVRLIALLRDPVRRALSAYNHHLARGRIPPHAPMEEVFFGEHRDLCRQYGILTMGMYDRHLADYRSAFDADRLLVLIFEEHVVQNPNEGLRRTCQFLQLDDTAFSPEQPDKARHRHAFSKPRAYLNYWLPLPPLLTGPLDLVFSPWKRDAPPAVRERLRAFYAPHVERTEDLLGRPIAAWSAA